MNWISKFCAWYFEFPYQIFLSQYIWSTWITTGSILRSNLLASIWSWSLLNNSGRFRNPNTQSHLCHLPPQIHLNKMCNVIIIIIILTPQEQPPQTQCIWWSALVLSYHPQLCTCHHCGPNTVEEEIIKKHWIGIHELEQELNQIHVRCKT